MTSHQGLTRVTRLLLWLLAMRPDVATVEASPAEPSQVHLEQCFRRESLPLVPQERSQARPQEGYGGRVTPGEPTWFC